MRGDLQGVLCEKLFENLRDVDVLDHLAKFVRQALHELAACALALIGSEVDPILRKRVSQGLADRLLGGEEARESQGHCASQKLGQRYTAAGFPCALLTFPRGVFAPSA